MNTMKTPSIVTPREWEAARQQLLVKEKELTRARDALAAERRRMPWLAVEKDYESDGPEGKASLPGLFEGRRQLIVYRAFFEPGVSGWPGAGVTGTPGVPGVAGRASWQAELDALRVREKAHTRYGRRRAASGPARYRADATPSPRSAALTGARPAATAAALAATLGLAAASWAVAVWQMHGMDMGTATRLGSFGFFIAVWVAMMAAMMLPGAAPAVLRRAHAGGRVRAVPLFAGSYLAVWALAGVVVYAVYQPHGTLAAGVVTVAAGAYEFTPLKKHFRRRCRDSTGSGLGFGLYCAGSGMGLMAMLVALGAMSITWMTVFAVIVLAQKLLPPKAAIDMPMALAIIGLGIWIVIAPASVPGLMPAM